MLTKLNLVLVSLAIVFSVPSFGAVTDKVYISGKIKDILKKSVVLETQTGDVYVPRKYFNEKHKRFRAGKHVRVMVSLVEIIDNYERNLASKKKLIQAPAKRSKSKRKGK